MEERVKVAILGPGNIEYRSYGQGYAKQGLRDVSYDWN